MKRTLDVLLALGLLLLLAPLLIVVAALIYAQDGHRPFYVSRRVGQGMREFAMIKFRSMRMLAERSRVMSTADDDPRITGIGHFIRRFKLDELPQLLNILRGDMSFVGPRPNVVSEVNLYSDEEKQLLTARPGITDLASIVFSDEGDILRGQADPDRAYNLLIRPWKSRLGLHYIRHQSLALDLELLASTAIALVSKPRALDRVVKVLRETGADPELVVVSQRRAELQPAPPPGVRPDQWERHLTYT